MFNKLIEPGISVVMNIDENNVIRSLWESLLITKTKSRTFSDEDTSTLSTNMAACGLCLS